MSLNRDTARRYTTRARAATIVLLAAGGAVIALPMPALRPSPSAAAIEDPSGAGEGDNADAASSEPPIDLQRAISTLWNFHPPAEPEPEVAPPEKDVIAVEGGATPTETAAAAAPGEWRYIGSIMGPRGMHGLLEREGRQKLVRVGDEVEESRVVAVDAEQLTLDDGRGLKHIRIAQRASRWSTTYPAPAQQVGGGAAARANMPGMTPNRANQPTRPPAVPPRRQPYNAQMNDEERERYELEKLEKYRELGESGGQETAEDGGGR